MLFNIGRVPGRDDQAPAYRCGGIGLDRFDARDQVGDLVDVPAVGGLPRTPLLAVDRPQFPIGVGPFVPDRDSVFLQVGDIRRTPQEPDQLVNDRIERQPLGRDERESQAQIKPNLSTENAEGVDLLARRAQHGAGRLSHAVGAYIAQQVKILPHAEGCSDTLPEWIVVANAEIISLRQCGFSGASPSLPGLAAEWLSEPAQQAAAR